MKVTAIELVLIALALCCLWPFAVITALAIGMFAVTGFGACLIHILTEGSKQ